MAKRYCEKCGKTMDDIQFYGSTNELKYPDGKLNQCKKCVTMHVDNWNPETYLWILEEINVPYVKKVWDSILEKHIDNIEKVSGTTILGKYLSQMKLNQWRKYTWADTEELKEKHEKEKEEALTAQGYSKEDIETKMAEDRTPAKPQAIIDFEQGLTPALVMSEEQIRVQEALREDEEFAKQLTEEDKNYLTVKWGSEYQWREKVHMEQFYNDMMDSYDIHGAGHKDTLIMLCKTSLKANQLIDINDIEGFQKMQKAYDSLMKSGHFTATQNKEDHGEFIDSIGELVALCEREGFIPRYYVDKPKDRVDETLEDLKRYTYTLVTEETSLGNMIEGALHQIERDQENESIIDTDDGNDDEDIMNYDSHMLNPQPEDYYELEEAFEEVDLDGIS